jgi:CTP synthase
MNKNLKYIFVVGGVMSGVGKGISAASIGKILQSRGFEITSIKIDPYVNVDAGTMNPTEHGEVFVLDDGMECDQDMGNYERFLNRDLTKDNYMTTGSVYLSLIKRERALGFGGKCVQVVPHVPLEVINRINNAAKKAKANIVITEIGGTVGEYENILFIEAVRILKRKYPDDVVVVLVSYLPQQGSEEELKTKPTQHAVRALNSSGIHPDLILARAAISLDKKRKEKIAFHCNVDEEAVISAPNVNSIYEVPVNFERDGLSKVILKKLNLKPKKQDLKEWRKLAKDIRDAKSSVKIGIVGKYFTTGSFVLSDSYISVIESIKHAAFYFKKKPEIHWIDADDFDPAIRKKREVEANLKNLKKYDGIIIPGGFGSRGTEGKIRAIRYARERKIPFLGLCYGMQLATIEFARNVVGLKGANTTEVNPETKYPVIDILPEQKKNLKEENFGATMRLGAYPAVLQKNTVAYAAYKNHLISERHRHRYEVNPNYIEKLKNKGLVFSGFSPDRRLMEILELPKSKHPFFAASQFHPEFKSRPLKPHPLFKEFVRAAIKR